MTGDPEDTAKADGNGKPGPRLQVVAGALDTSAPPPRVRLVREWKGLTVADLYRDELVERLPGQMRSALRHIEAGDFAAAERALPGDDTPVYAGPGHRRPERRLLVLMVAMAAVLAAFAVAEMFTP